MSAPTKNNSIYGVSRTPAGGQRPVGYATIGAAIADAGLGDRIDIGPGYWAESFTIPTLVSVFGAGAGITVITGAAATGTRVTVGLFSGVAGVTVQNPTDATYAILNAGAQRATVDNCVIYGDGGLGRGIGNTGTGITVVTNTIYSLGTSGSFGYVSNGTLFIDLCRVDGGTLTDGILAAGGTIQTGNFIIQPAATVTDGVEVGNATALLSMIALSATNSVHITNDNAAIIASNIFHFGSTWDILVDPGVDQSTGQYYMHAGSLAELRISADGAWHENQNVVLGFNDEQTDDEAVKFWSEINVGHAEQGREAVFGEGDSYTRGMKVVTSDSTGTGNYTDVSAAARSATGSTFSFQGVASGHCIYIGSELESSTDVLKHWGIKVKQTTAAVEVTPKSFVFEIWNGASWAAIGVMATHSSLFYRYANEVFIRANISEHIRYGINDDTTWAKTTIDGSNLYWARIRITANVTTAPVFEQFKLSTSRSELNADGTHTFHGNARFVARASAASNDGESGGVGGSSLPVGAGGGVTGWNHIGRDQLLNGNGDAVYYQFILPHGIDTSYPITMRFHCAIQAAGTGNVTIICSILPLEAANVLEADPTGGATPVARSLANTELTTAKAATAVTDNTSIDGSVANKVQRAVFSNVDVSDYYEGDMLVVRLELDIDGGGANVVALQLGVDALIWTPGEKF